MARWCDDSLHPSVLILNTPPSTQNMHTPHTPGHTREWRHKLCADIIVQGVNESHLMFGHKCTQLIWFCESKNVWKMQRKHTIVRIIYTRHIMTLFMNKASLMHTLCFTVITAQKYLNMRILEARPLRATHGGKQQRCTELTLIHPNNTLILPNNTLDNTWENPNM